MPGRTIRFSGLVAFVVALIIGPAVSAQDAGISGTPASETSSAPRFALVAQDEQGTGRFSDLEVEPGQSRELTVSVVNVGDVHASLRTYKVNALSSINGGFISDEESAEPVGSNAWVDYPTRSIELAPGTQEDITFSVTVPADAQPGQYISGLVVETADALVIDGGGALDQILGYAITVGILVPGEVIYEFELGDPVIGDSAGNRSVEMPFVNTGSYLVRPAGELVVTDAEGNDVLTTPVQMGSVYAGLSTLVEVILPEQMAGGDYTISLSLTDDASGATASIDSAEVAVPDLGDTAGVSVESVAIEPNADEIVFANVDLTLNNGGQQIPASNVTLDVMRDGELVESVPLATNQILLSGENQFTDRYIPEEMWQSGTYTFSITVSAVDPNGGQETILLDEELDATIVVP